MLEPLLTFFAVTAVVSALFWIGRAVPFVGENLHGAIAVMFLYAPALAARLSRRRFDYRESGLRVEPVGLNAAVAGIGIAATWPIFFVAFLTFYTWVCREGLPGFLASWTEVFVPLCVRWTGLAGAHLRLPPDFALVALSQIVVIAVPEEFFFRGYLLTRLEERWPSRRRLWGAPVGWPLVLSSVLFGLGHVLVDFDPQRMVVFFPGLVFGFMRARTGSIAAGALFHALCNLFSDVLHASFRS